MSNESQADMSTSSQAKTLADILTTNHGVYEGNWTEPSVRLAGGGDMRRVRVGAQRQRPAVYGHWVLPNGDLTGQLPDHAKSALAALEVAVSGYKPQADPISDLMQQAGVIRVRHSPPTLCVIDIVRTSTREQMQKLSELARTIEDNGGNFLWTVINGRDTNTLGEGNSYAELCEFHWPR